MSGPKRAKKLGVFEEDNGEMSPQQKVFNSGYLMRDIVKWTDSRPDFHSIRQVVPGGVNVQWYADRKFRDETRLAFKPKYYDDPRLQTYFNSRGRKVLRVMYKDAEADFDVMRVEELTDSSSGWNPDYVFNIKNLVVTEYDNRGREVAKFYPPQKGEMHAKNQPYDAQFWSDILKDAPYEE